MKSIKGDIDFKISVKLMDWATPFSQLYMGLNDEIRGMLSREIWKKTKEPIVYVKSEIRINSNEKEKKDREITNTYFTKVMQLREQREQDGERLFSKKMDKLHNWYLKNKIVWNH